jgi:hypothetical protein
MPKEYKNLTPIFVHANCHDDDCDGECDGGYTLPSEEEYELLLSSPLDSMPIDGWNFTAGALLGMLRA